jgi:uncharacterized protein YbjT (DUF2867 family)
MKALLVGATGLVGRFVLERLLAQSVYADVEVWVRRELPPGNPKLTQRVVDFSNLHSLPVRAEHIFCCLGTTIRKAGSEAAFREVDHDYPLTLARLAKSGGARKFLMVSALGANPDSSVFYNRVKGEVEQAVAALGLPAAYFFRPSLLLGPREDNRPAERIGAVVGKLISPLLRGSLRKYRPIHVDAVAAVMLFAATHDLPPGAIESDVIAQLAARESQGLEDSGAR